MCPVCAATIALLAAGATTAVGATTLVVKKRRSKIGNVTDSNRMTPESEVKGEDHESSEDRRQ
jgi:hypothetical protein